MKLNEILGFSRKEKYANKLKDHTRVQDLTKSDPDYDYDAEMEREAKYLDNDSITSKNDWMNIAATHAKTPELGDEIRRLRMAFARATNNGDMLMAAKIFKQFQHTGDHREVTDQLRVV